MKTFEDYLKGIHAKGYTGTDDDMPDAFDSWLATIDSADTFMKYAEQYANAKFEEVKSELLKRMMKYDSRDGYSTMHDDVLEKVSNDVDSIINNIKSK